VTSSANLLLSVAPPGAPAKILTMSAAGNAQYGTLRRCSPKPNTLRTDAYSPIARAYSP
jgi:hypothetical protein